MFPARMALAKVVDTTLGRTRNEEGNDDCNLYTAKLRLFQKASASFPSTLSLNDITNQTFEIINTNTAPLLEGEQVIVAQGPDERWFTLQKPHPKFQFVTQGKITDRAVQVKVLRTMNAPPNLDNPGRVLEYGDTLTIYDPFNLWSDIEANGTGWAYLAYQQEDNVDTSEINEQHVVRYEIEECSLPVNEIEATLRDCLPGGLTTGVALVDIDNQAIRSAYPNVDHPPEVPEPAEGAASTEVEVLFDNPHHLDGIGGSRCVLRRITNLQTSDPENYSAPSPRSSTQADWEVVHISKKVARHIKVVFTPGFGWQSTNYYDGFAASTGTGNNCEEFITCNNMCECDSIRSEEGDEGYAFLDTTAQTLRYYVYSTKSAFFPLPKRHKILAAPEDQTSELLRMSPGSCNIEYTTVYASLLCWEEPAYPAMTIPTTTTQLATCEGGSMEVQQCSGSCEWTYYDTPQPTWTKVTSCSDPNGLGCDCTQPSVADPVSGQTYTSDCTGQSQLCLTLGTRTIRHLGCDPAFETGTCPPICIPLDPPGGGGGGGGDCPDPCATTTTGGTGTGEIP